MNLIKKFLLGIFCVCILGCEKSETEYFESMDTFMKVQCYGKNPSEANDIAQKKIGELNVLISVTKPESDIYKINNATSFPVEVSDDTISVIWPSAL